MKKSPYAPPRSKLGDPRQVPPIPLPVYFALFIFWAQLAVGTVRSFLELSSIPEIEKQSALWTIGGSLLVNSFLNIMIGQGRQWARVIQTVLSVIGIAVVAFYALNRSMLFKEMNLGPIDLGIFAGTCIALVLLYQSSANSWFAEMKKVRAG